MQNVSQPPFSPLGLSVALIVPHLLQAPKPATCNFVAPEPAPQTPQASPWPSVSGASP